MKSKIMAAGLPAFVFAINTVIGISFKEYGGFGYIFSSRLNLVKAAGIIIGLTILFGVFLYGIYMCVMKIDCSLKRKLSRWKVTWLSFAVLLICYVPYLYIYFPGSMNSDSVDQLTMYFGFSEMTNHHPFLSSLLMGWFVELGMKFGNGALGIFMYVFMQTLVLAFAFAYTLGTMVKWNLSEKMVIVCLAFYGLTPFWGGYAQLVIKDTLYTAVIVLFVTIFLECLVEKNVISNAKFLALILSGILSALLRNNGIYVVVISLLGGMFFSWKKRSRGVFIKSLIVCLGFWLVWGNIALPLFQVKDGSIREMLSIPFQQTARYIQEYDSEVTEEERLAINTVLDYEWVQDMYTSYGADPVKNTYKEPEKEGEALANYFKHWFLMFFKHPTVYLEATIANSYYYYCANVSGSIESIYVDEIYENTYSEQLGLVVPKKHIEAREYLSELLVNIQETPVLRLLLSEGFYTYILMGMMGFFIYLKKKKFIVGLLPNILGVLVCIASPVLGSFRYYLPVIACTCILLAYCFKCKEDFVCYENRETD